MDAGLLDILGPEELTDGRRWLAGLAGSCFEISLVGRNRYHTHYLGSRHYDILLSVSRSAKARGPSMSFIVVFQEIFVSGATKVLRVV